MKIVVTGARGLVGSRVARLLARRGHGVVAVSRNVSPGEEDGVRYEACDLTDPRAAASLLERVRPEVVVHAAGLTDVDACERMPELAYACNVEATANLVRACRLAGAHLVHTSTDYVFDGRSGPYTEEDVPNPRGVYALTKHASEETVLALMPSAAIARTAVVYGWPASVRPNFGTWLLENLRQGKQVRLFSDQLISPSFAGNVAEMIAELAQRRLGGIWNTAGGSVVDRVTFGRAFCTEFGFDPGLLVPSTLAEVAMLAPRPARCGLLTQKARQQLTARPLDLPESLRRFREECKAAGVSVPR